MTRKRALLLMGFAIAAAALALPGIRVAAQEEVRNCSICHGRQSYRRLVLDSGEISNLFVDEAELAASVHHNRTCTDCHTDVTSMPHEGYRPLPVDCTRCHFLGNPVGAPQSEVYQAYAESVHGEAVSAGNPRAPRCQDCHGSHDVRPPASSESSVSHFNVAYTCGRCHSDQFAAFRRSVHGVGIYEERSGDAPDCSDCHGEHNIFAHQDPRSRVYATRVADDCAACHEALQIVGEYGVETERLETYRRSFHGIANRYGSTVAANCASCHGFHEVLPSSDPRSMVHLDNIPSTCGQSGCHEGAGTNFAMGKVHINPEEEESGLVYYVSQFFRYFTIAVILSLCVHIGLDLGRRFIGAKKRKGAEDGGGSEGRES